MVSVVGADTIGQFVGTQVGLMTLCANFCRSNSFIQSPFWVDFAAHPKFTSVRCVPFGEVYIA
jgi:hypothetical protein